MAEAASERRARDLRFLVVDDQEDIRTIFCRLIERAGHRAMTAQDGQEAVEVLQVASFDVMLLDIGMPRMDGLEVVRWLNAHPDVAPGLRVVVVSAWAVENIPALGALGVDNVIAKPLRLQQLNDLIAQVEREVASVRSG